MSQNGFGGSHQGFPQHPATQGLTAQPPMPPSQAPSSVPYGGFPMTDELAEAGRRRAQEIREIAQRARGGGGGPKIQRMKIAGPMQDGKWKGAPVGSKGYLATFLLPSWAQGRQNFNEFVRHFAMAAGEYHGGFCPENPPPGKEAGPCYICAAYSLGLDQGEKNQWGRKQRVFTYQGFPFHYDPATRTAVPDVESCSVDGVVKPMVFDANSTIFETLQSLVALRKASTCFDPNHGRIFLIEKEKFGDQQMDVRYQVFDLCETPLPDCFKPGLGHMYNIDDLYQPMSVIKQKEFIIAAGLPMPVELGGAPGGQQQSLPQPTVNYGQPAQQMPQPAVDYGQPVNVPPAGQVLQPQGHQPVYQGQPATQGVVYGTQTAPLQTVVQPVVPPTLPTPTGRPQTTVYAAAPGAVMPEMARPDPTPLTSTAPVASPPTYAGGVPPPAPEESPEALQKRLESGSDDDIPF